jgi:hypothetical protein
VTAAHARIEAVGRREDLVEQFAARSSAKEPTVPVQPHNDAGRSSTRPPEGVYRWGLMFRALWIAVFAPFLIGFLISGVLGHWVFLIAFAFWLGALACVLRAEALNTRARSTESPSAGLLGARAGWLLVALILVFGSAGIIHLVLGP